MKIIAKRLFLLSLITNFIFIILGGYFTYKVGGASFVLAKMFQPNKAKAITEAAWLNNDYYNDKSGLFATLPVTNNAIIFAGDSITSGCEWDELFGKPNMKNRGINGDTTYGLLNRLDSIVQSKPSKIFLMIGVNDLQVGRSMPEIKQDYEKILMRFTTELPNTKIYAQSVLPSNSSKYPKLTQDNIVALNTEIEQLSRMYNVTYVDLYSKMVSNEGTLRPELTNGGLHLNANGYLIWKNVISKYI